MNGKSGIAKIFVRGRSQVVHLPSEFHLPGNEVRVRRVGNALLLEPLLERMPFDVDAWFAALDRFDAEPFMEEGREQPPMPDARVLLP